MPGICYHSYSHARADESLLDPAVARFNSGVGLERLNLS
jgi:hypothetical protein